MESGHKRANLLKDAQTSLKEALRVCAKPGVLNNYLKLAEVLAPLDSKGDVMLALRRGFRSGEPSS